MFRGDLNAGITVAIMLIPQGMAYAVLAGMPPVYGLYASIIPIVLYALFGTSRQLAVGPVAMISLLVLAGISEFAEPGSERFIQLAILTALGVGVVQVLMGLFRMGFLVNFLSHPVLSGFTSAAAVIIASSQIRNLFGIEMPRTSNVFETLFEAGRNIATVEPFTAAIGITSVLAIVFIKKWKKTFPTALLVVAAGTIATAVWELNSHGVNIVGEIPKGLPSFDASFFDFSDGGMLVPLILVIALVSYMESIAVAKAIANKRGYKIDANKELIGLGMANLGGSFFQSFPTTGGLSRTAVNDQAGSTSTVASLISAALIAITVLYLTPLFYYLPGAVLAAIIIVAVFGLFDAAEMKHLWRTDKRDFAMLMITFAATLGLGIEEGIAIGVIMSLGMVIYRSTRPHVAELGRLGKTSKFKNIERYPDAVIHPDVLIFRFDAPLYFANASFFREELDARINKRRDELKLVILDAASMSGIDSTGTEAMEKLVKEMHGIGVEIYIASATGPVRDSMRNSGMMEHLGEDHFFFDVADALRCWDGQDADEALEMYSPCQTN